MIPESFEDDNTPVDELLTEAEPIDVLDEGEPDVGYLERARAHLRGQDREQ
jgi:hypothetical protein